MKSLYEAGKEQTGSWCSDTIIEMKEEISMKKVLLMVEEGNMSHIVNGEFGGTPMTQSEEIANLTKSVKSGKGMVMGPGGVIRPKGDSSIQPEEGNFTEVKAGTFAGNHPDQWYEKSPLIFQGEVAEMRRQYPDAQLGFLQSTGDMYWVVTLNMTETGIIKPYKIMLMYDKCHPSNSNYGGSVKSILLDPDVTELRERAKQAGRKSIPHLLGSDNSFVYLCTRLPEQVQAGRQNLSAVQAAGNAADWILAFELGLRDKSVWNHKFCGEAHRNAWIV